MLQMIAGVQLDASHVSRCVTARREKVPRYIRVSNELWGTHAFRLLLYNCENESTLRENFARFLQSSWLLLLVIGGSVADLGVGAWSAAAAPFCSFAGSWGESRWKTEANTAQKPIQVWRGKAPTFRSIGRITIDWNHETIDCFGLTPSKPTKTVFNLFKKIPKSKTIGCFDKTTSCFSLSLKNTLNSKRF